VAGDLPGRKSHYNVSDRIPPLSLAFCNKVMQEMYEQELADVKKEVEEKRDAAGSEEPMDTDEAGADGNKEEHERIMTVRQYQACVQFIPPLSLLQSVSPLPR
jgi:hypothetical protein